MMIEWAQATHALDHWLRKYDLGGAKLVLEFKTREDMNNAKMAFYYELTRECKFPQTEYGKKPVYPRIDSFEIEFTSI